MDENDRIPDGYGPPGPMITLSIYRDRGCTDRVTVVRLIPGLDTLTVDDACTIRLNEPGA